MRELLTNFDAQINDWKVTATEKDKQLAQLSCELLEERKKNKALKRDLKKAGEEANFIKKTFKEEAAEIKKTHESRLMEIEAQKEQCDTLIKGKSVENINLRQELEATRKGMQVLQKVKKEMETELTQQNEEKSEKMDVLAKTLEIAREEALAKEGELAEEIMKNHEMSEKLQDQRKLFKQQLIVKTSETKALTDELDKRREDINRLREDITAKESQFRRKTNDQHNENQRLKAAVERTKREALAVEADLSSQLQNKNDKIVRLNLELDDFDEVKKQRVRTF